MFALKLITAPAIPVVSLSEAKAHLRVDDSDEDDLIAELVMAATDHAQRLTRRQFVHATYRLSMDAFPSSSRAYRLATLERLGSGGAAIRFPIAPVSSVTSIEYIDVNGDTQTLSAAAYKVDADGEPARVLPAYDQVWPEARCEANAVQVTFVAGYSANAAGVPSDAKALVKLMLGHLYENREASIVGTSANELPLGVKSLAAALRWGGYP